MSELWGLFIPSWIGSIGGLASAGVAIAAFVQSIRNKRSVHSVKAALAPEHTALAEGSRAPRAAEATTPAAEPWSLTRDPRGNGLTLTNGSGAPLTLVGIQVFDGTGWAPASLARQDRVDAGTSRTFTLAALGARPSNLNVVRLSWLEQDGSIQSQRILV